MKDHRDDRSGRKSRFSIPARGRGGFTSWRYRSGRFSRVIELPAPVEEARTNVRYERGLLEVRLAKKAPGGNAGRVEIE